MTTTADLTATPTAELVARLGSPDAVTVGSRTLDISTPDGALVAADALAEAGDDPAADGLRDRVECWRELDRRTRYLWSAKADRPGAMAGAAAWYAPPPVLVAGTPVRWEIIAWAWRWEACRWHAGWRPNPTRTARFASGRRSYPEYRARWFLDGSVYVKDESRDHADSYSCHRADPLVILPGVPAPEWLSRGLARAFDVPA